MKNKTGRSSALWLILFLMLMLLSLVPVHTEPTSKVTWEDRRGFPFSFLTLDRYTGPCQIEACTRLQLADFDLGAFALDFLILFILAGIASLLAALLARRRRRG